MINAFERSSLLFLAGVVIVAVGGAALWSSSDPERVSTAGAPAESSLADEPLAAPMGKPAGPPLTYDLEAVAAGAPVPRVVATALPESVKANDLDIERAEVLMAVLPLVLLVNEEILAERRQLWDVRFNVKGGFRLPPQQRLWIEVLAERYGASSDDFNELARRVDAVPPSIVLALVGEALEQKRREALERERKAAARRAKAGPASEAADGPPGSKRPPKETVTAAMPDVATAPFGYVRAIVHALNTAPAYRSFRAERERLRQAGEPLDGQFLARALRDLRSGPIRAPDLGATINSHRLTRFDKARLQPSSPSG